MKRQIRNLIRPRLMSVRRNGEVIYDPICQPNLHAHQCAKRRQQAEETNAVFRQAVEKRRPVKLPPVAKKSVRFWLRRALVAVAMLWDVRIAR